jgi:hypothetical protein
MKKIFFIFTFAFCGNIFSQSIGPTPKELINIFESGKFNQLTKLVARLNYVIVDSSVDEKGKLFYKASESKNKKNILTCETDTNSKIRILGFSTFDKNQVDVLRNYLKKINYESSGILKKPSGQIAESEDFTKESFLITYTESRHEFGLKYEFTFFNFKN